METKAQVRINYVDWLRVFGVLFVFIYHTTRLYNVEDWYIKNQIWWTGVEVWNGFATSFMMPLMFAISGVSLFYALGKGGFIKFLKVKALRLLIPLALGILVYAALQGYLKAIWHNQFSGSFFEFLPQYFTLGIDTKGAHLWYLEYLFLFSVILYPLMRWLKGSGRSFLSKLDGVIAKTGVLYSLMLPFLILYILVGGDSPLMEQNGGYPYIAYLWILLLGFLILSDEGLRNKVFQLRWVSLGVGLALVIGFCILYNTTSDKTTVSLPLVLALIMRVFGGWICLLGFLGLGMQFLAARSPRLDYANEAVLPFYILHQTIILGVAYFVLQWGLPDLLEWVVVVVISFILIMACYEYGVRRWNVMRILFGMKRLQARPAEGAVKPQLDGAARAG
jgi:glucans biosynthesis protein C